MTEKRFPMMNNCYSEEVQFFKCESIKGRDALYTILKR